MVSNKYNVFKWIERVIGSCTNMSQLQAVDKLMFNFFLLYEDIPLLKELKSVYSRKEDTLIIKKCTKVNKNKEERTIVALL